MNEVGLLICGFVERSGGIEKVEAAREAIRNMPDEQRADFIRRVAATDAGARQLCAAALLGFSIAAEVYNAGLTAEMGSGETAH